MALSAAIQSKKCSGCREPLPLSAFGRDISTVIGLNIYCKVCIRVKARKRIGTDAYRKYQREYRRKRRRRDPVFAAACYAITMAWRKKNPERFQELHDQSHYRREMHMYGNEHEEGITMDLLYARDKGVCGICKIRCSRMDASIDHIIPVSKGGGHIWTNVQLAHGTCNTAKGNRWWPSQ